jgi:AcrR family transcriptional regulator
MFNRNAMQARNPQATKQQILDVAERHFGIYGFAGASLRGIIKDAKVNIAAVAYHYGTKEELFSAVLERFARPVVTEQLKQLEAVRGERELSKILLAFYLPPLSLVKSKGRAGETLAQFLGRIQTEPEPVFSLVDQNFAECRNRFIDAFRACLPEATDEDLHWNFEFMLSLIVTCLTRQMEIRKRYTTKTSWTPEETAERMVRFCEAGIRA